MAFTPKSFEPETFEEEVSTPTRSSAVTQATPVKNGGANLLQKILVGAGDVFMPRTTNMYRQIGHGLTLKNTLPQLQQADDERFKSATELTARAKQETDPQRKQLLLNQARQLMDGAGQETQRVVGQAEKDLGIEGGKDLPSILRTALGFAGETGVTFAPTGVLGRGQTAAGRILRAGGEGLLRGGAYGLTTPEGGVREVADQTIKDALTGGVVSGGLTAAGEAAKKVLPKIGRAIKGGGQSMVASQYNVPRGVASQNRLQDTIGDLADYGITKVDDVEKAADKVTGKDGAISRLTRDAVGQADNVIINPTEAGMPSAGEVARNIVQDPSLPVGQDQKLLAEFDRDLLNVQKVPGNENIGKANPLDVFDLIKKYERKAADLLRYRPERASGASSTDEALGKAYGLMADELKDRLYMQAGADNAAAGVVDNPEVLKQLSEVSPKLADKVKNAKTVAELRAIAAPFVRGSNLTRATEAGEQIATQNVAGVAKGPLGRYVQNFNALNPLSWLPLEPIASSRAVNAGLGKGAMKAGGALERGANSQNMQNAIELLTRLGLLGAVGNNQPQSQNVNAR